MAKSKYSIVGEIADFDYHGNWGDFTSARSLKAFLGSVGKDDEVELEINSPGGSVIKGIEMANAVKQCAAKVTARVTGLAASMASVVACACDEIEMDEASFFMIHNPWSQAEGDAEELRKQAGLLDQMKTALMSFYRGKFGGKTDDEIAALMDAETWWTANECLENKVAAKVWPSDVKVAASVSERTFAKMPELAAQFLARRELTDEGKAEIAAARAASVGRDVPGAPSAEAAAPSAECGVVSAECGVPSAEAGRDVPGAPSTHSALVTPPSELDWKARYQGASKKINELGAARDAACAARDEACAARDEALAARDEALAARDEALAARQSDLDQVKALGYEDLAGLVAAVSGLKTDLEKSGKDLADARQQLSHLKETRDLLTGGVLGATMETYAAKMSAAKTPEEREKLRALKQAGKIK